MSSPWERALGRSIEQLDPGLRAYFGQIPPGMVGRGSGVFDVVGTPKRWLWPLLAVLALDGIVFPPGRARFPSLSQTGRVAMAPSTRSGCSSSPKQAG